MRWQGLLSASNKRVLLRVTDGRIKIPKNQGVKLWLPRRDAQQNFLTHSLGFTTLNIATIKPVTVCF